MHPFASGRDVAGLVGAEPLWLPTQWPGGHSAALVGLDWAIHTKTQSIAESKKK